MKFILISLLMLSPQAFAKHDLSLVYYAVDKNPEHFYADSVASVMQMAAQNKFDPELDLDEKRIVAVMIALEKARWIELSLKAKDLAAIRQVLTDFTLFESLKERFNQLTHKRPLGKRSRIAVEQFLANYAWLAATETYRQSVGVKTTALSLARFAQTLFRDPTINSEVDRLGMLQTLFKTVELVPINASETILEMLTALKQWRSTAAGPFGLWFFFEGALGFQTVRFLMHSQDSAIVVAMGIGLTFGAYKLWNSGRRLGVPISVLQRACSLTFKN